MSELRFSFCQQLDVFGQLVIVYRQTLLFLLGHTPANHADLTLNPVKQLKLLSRPHLFVCFDSQSRQAVLHFFFNNRHCCVIGFVLRHLFLELHFILEHSNGTQRTLNFNLLVLVL